MAKLIIKNGKGELAGAFDAHANEPIAFQAQSNGVMVPTPCGMGACGMCVAICTKGIEFLDPEAFGPQHIPQGDGRVLTCICGIKKDAPVGAEIELTCENL